MTSLFIKIFNMSITASYIALAVILFRTLIRKSPKIFSYALWSALLLRLIFPLNISSSLSLLKPLKVNSNYIPSNIEMMDSPAINTNIEIIDKVVNNSLPKPVPSSSVNPMQITMGIITDIWILGIIILIIYAMYAYIKVYKKVQFAILMKDNIYETDMIHTPFVLGFIKPKIYLPKEIKDTELNYIVAHEKTHIKRFDYLIKPLSFLVLTIHWFNPIMWISYYLMIKDMEMSCDERVLKESNEDLRKDYSTSLLNLSIKQSNLILPLAFGEKNIKSRIKNILNYKRPKFWTILIALIIVIAIFVSLLTNPINNPAEKRAKEFLKLYYTIENTDIADMIYDPELYVGENANIDENGFGLVDISGIEEALGAKYSKFMTKEILDKLIGNRIILAGEIAAREFGSKLKPMSINLFIEETAANKTEYQYAIQAEVNLSDGREEIVNLQGSIVMKKIDNKWEIDRFTPDTRELSRMLQYGRSVLYIINYTNAPIRMIEIHTKSNTMGAMNANNSNIKKNERFEFEILDAKALKFTVKLLDADRNEILSRSFTGDFSNGKDIYLYIEEDEIGKLMINRGNSEGTYPSVESINWRIMVNDIIYAYTGIQVPAEIDESAVLGKVSSIVGLYEGPSKNGEANFDIKGAKYAQFEGDIVVLIDNEWVLFKKNEDMKMGISMGDIGFLMNDLNDEEMFRVFRTISKYIKLDEDYEANLDSIIEKSFKECGIDEPSIINAAKENLEIKVTK